MNIFGICTESSHKKGMGHLFRMLNLIELIESNNGKHIVFINNDSTSISLLKKREIPFQVVELNNSDSGWETAAIKRYGINIWINDRLDTEIKHSRNIKKNGVRLISFDDRGSGAEIADVNFASLPSNFNCNLKGEKVFSGLQYLILNKEIDGFKRVRRSLKRNLVSLGGSDTYGVTVEVIKILKKINISADIVIGPCFGHLKELQKVMDANYRVIRNPHSLIKEFHGYDLAVTGGGITPFEANASGLPCIIVANEQHEIDNGIFLDSLGSSVFAGYHTDIDENTFKEDLDINKMSKIGLGIRTDGVDNIYRIINSL